MQLAVMGGEKAERLLSLKKITIRNSEFVCQMEKNYQRYIKIYFI